MLSTEGVGWDAVYIRGGGGGNVVYIRGGVGCCLQGGGGGGGGMMQSFISYGGIFNFPPAHRIPQDSTNALLGFCPQTINCIFQQFYFFPSVIRGFYLE